MTVMPETATTRPAAHLADLPIVVIGGGPVGLVAAAHLAAYGLTPVVFEAGDQIGAAMRTWGHIRTFTPWRYIVDTQAEKLLAPTGWARPETDRPPTGDEIVRDYLQPLAAALGPGVVHTGSRVVAVARHGLDKSRTIDRAERPFLVRVRRPSGSVEDVLARAVIDASGTWEQPNPLGASGLAAHGETDAAAFLVGPLPDVLGRDRARFAGRRTLVVGLGHSAANTLLSLGRLAREHPGTDVVWAIRPAGPDRLYGGGDADELAARGQLGSDLRSLVATGEIDLVTDFSTERLEVTGHTVGVVGRTSAGERRIDGVHNIAAATGFRPDLTILNELQLDLDPGLEAPRQLAPLIDPQFHSCGTVPPHGHRDLAHPEPGFFIVGMKSYGRAPTFLITTGNEQVRSIAAALAGDLASADEVRLQLPETGVCSVSLPLTDDSAGGCCGTPTGEARDSQHQSLPAGAAQGFSRDAASGSVADLELTAASAQRSCCG